MWKDDGALYRALLKQPGVRESVISSHKSRVNAEQYRYETPFGEILFGTMLAGGDTWFQYERYSIRFPWVICHTCTYGEAKVTAMNVGPGGRSPYTEAKPLFLTVCATDAGAFLGLVSRTQPSAEKEMQRDPYDLGE